MVKVAAFATLRAFTRQLPAPMVWLPELLRVIVPRFTAEDNADGTVTSGGGEVKSALSHPLDTATGRWPGPT